MGRIISKSYGEKDYKGFILLKNKKNNTFVDCITCGNGSVHRRCRSEQN